MAIIKPFKIKSFKKKDVNIYFLSNNLHKNYTKLLSKNNLKYINLKNSKNEKNKFYPPLINELF